MAASGASMVRIRLCSTGSMDGGGTGASVVEAAAAAGMPEPILALPSFVVVAGSGSYAVGGGGM
jgi:hypothetical protein